MVVIKVKLVAIYILLLALVSCEKNISLKPDSQTPKLVVEATIENGQPPIVFLSNSVDYFSQINPEILENSFVRNADVYISDGTKTHKLAEKAVTSDSGYTIYYYTNDDANPGTAIIGALNTAYQLRIVTDGKEYQATTHIPMITKKIDSLWWEPLPFSEPQDSNKVDVKIKVTDPPGFGDYVRYFTKRDSEPFYPGFNSVYDDQVIDGTTYIIPVDRGVDRNAERTDDEVFFEKGDTVTVKVCNIDKATYNFWRTFEFSYQSVGNPFSSPTKIESNISGGALGYFGGYAAQFRGLIIPK